MEMSKYGGFYFAHNLDFRGRAYPIPPHLNHLGSDICRGLLKLYAGMLCANAMLLCYAATELCGTKECAMGLCYAAMPCAGAAPRYDAMLCAY
eukprot:1592539-Rhodomonas_salina.1